MHTKIPWPWLRAGHTVYALMHAGWRKGEELFKNRFSVQVQHDRECPVEEAEAVARLIRAAPDHAMICSAMCAGAGRWEPFNSCSGGEFCINGFRHSTELDEFGCPIVTESIRAAILRAKGDVP